MNRVIKANDINDLEACFKELMKEDKLTEKILHVPLLQVINNLFT